MINGMCTANQKPSNTWVMPVVGRYCAPAFSKNINLNFETVKQTL
jgi:hypothetical protein